jgi:hypothetical protein
MLDHIRADKAGSTGNEQIHLLSADVFVAQSLPEICRSSSDL